MIDAAASTADAGIEPRQTDPDGEPVAAMAALFRMVFEYSATATMLVSDSHVIMRANPAAHRLLHSAFGALVGQSLDEFCPIDWASQAEQQNVAWPADEHPRNASVVGLVTADGNGRLAHLHAAVVPPQAGRLRYLVQFSPATALDTSAGQQRAELPTTTGAENDDGHSRSTRPPRVALSGEQRALLDQLAIVEARERTRMAEIIHDEPIQLVVAAMMRLDNLQQRLDATDADELDKTADLLEGAVDQLRDLIVVALTPPDLSDGLGVALRDLAAGIFAATNTDFAVDGREHAHLVPSTQTAVYNILRDVLVGIRKAARAQHIKLDIADHEDDLVFSLTYDSKASILDPRGSGCDLVTLRARAAAVGGELILQNEARNGPTLVLTVPKPLWTP